MPAGLSRAAWFFRVMISLHAGSSDAAVTGSPLGVWLTQDGDGVVQIYQCGAGFCGRIVGMSETVRPDGSRPMDRAGHPQCGLTILRETSETETHVWSGRITNPDDGATWNCEFWLEADGLHLRGYVLVPLLGQSQLWQPYHGALHPDCRMN